MPSSRTSSAAVSRRQSGILSIFRWGPSGFYTRASVIGLLWMFGLYSVFLSPAPVSITPEMRRRYELKSIVAEIAETGTLTKYDAYIQARAHTNQAKVWFWRFQSQPRSESETALLVAGDWRCVRQEVRNRQVLEKEAKQKYIAAQKHYRSLLSEAKTELGIWTEAGVDEGRQLFWNSFESGKVAAQRQSFWDAIVTLIASRESDVLYKIIELLIMVCLNFTTGMFMAIFLFVFRLPSLILSFQPTAISGVLFFLASCVGGLSVVLSFLALLYGSATVFLWTLGTARHPLLTDRRRPSLHLD